MMIRWLYRLAYPAFIVDTRPGAVNYIPRGYRPARDGVHYVEPTLRTRAARWLLRQIGA